MLAPVERIATRFGELGIGPATRVVIYDEIGGEFAARLFWTLEYLGHPRVSLLDGGFKKWAVERRPTTAEVQPVQPAQFQARLDPTRYADAAYVLLNLKAGGVVLVDARSAREYRGEVASRDVKRAGRIPGAVGIDWEENLAKQDGYRSFKGPEALAKLYEEAGVTKEREVIAYCRTGVRASHTYFVLRLLGYPRARVYDGSMIEWGNRAELPLEK